MVTPVRETKKAKMIQIPIHGNRAIQKKLEKTKRGWWSYRLRHRARKIDKFIKSKADNKYDAAEDIIEEIKRFNSPQIDLPKLVLPQQLHTWSQIFHLLDTHSDNGEKQIGSAKTAMRRFLRGIGHTESHHPHECTKDLCERWMEAEINRGKTPEQKLTIKKKLNVSLRQAKYGLFKRSMMKYYNIADSFNFTDLKVLRFKATKYKRPQDDRHFRADKYFREVVKHEDPIMFGFYELMRISAQRNIEVAHAKRINLLPHCIVNDRIVPKKNEVEREIPYPDGFSEADRQFLLNLNPDGEFVLPGTDYDREYGFTKKINSHLKQFGFTAYQLRKEWACQLLEADVPLHVVAEMMGNTVQILVDHYVASEKPKYKLQRG